MPFATPGVFITFLEIYFQFKLNTASSDTTCQESGRLFSHVGYRAPFVVLDRLILTFFLKLWNVDEIWYRFSLHAVTWLYSMPSVLPTSSLTVFHNRLSNQFDVFHCSIRSPSTATSLVEIVTSPLVLLAICFNDCSFGRDGKKVGPPFCQSPSQALFTLTYSQQLQTLWFFDKRGIL